MKPARFDYIRATSQSEATQALAAEGADARVIAGGQTLVPMLSMRLARPKVLVDIMGLSDLARIETGERSLRVGAAVRQATLLAHPQLGRLQPLLAAALPWVGHAQTRNRGTICGSIAHADPSAELPLVLVALGGDVHLAKRWRQRSVAAEDFFSGLMSTARDEDELITGVTFPVARPGQGFAFNEFGRRHGDFAITACAAVADQGGIRLAVGGVADRPIARTWDNLYGSALDDALNEFAHGLDARDDLHASARLRRDLVRKLGAKTIAEARRCLV